MVLKIEDYYIEIEDFRTEFCSKTRGLFSPILAKKVLYKKKVYCTTRDQLFDLLLLFPTYTRRFLTYLRVGIGKLLIFSIFSIHEYN